MRLLFECSCAAELSTHSAAKTLFPSTPFFRSPAPHPRPPPPKPSWPLPAVLPHQRRRRQFVFLRSILTFFLLFLFPFAAPAQSVALPSATKEITRLCCAPALPDKKNRQVPLRLRPLRVGPLLGAAVSASRKPSAPPPLLL